MENNKELFSQIDNFLKNFSGKRIIISGHINTDFDCLGSILSFYKILKEFYKKDTYVFLERNVYDYVFQKVTERASINVITEDSNIDFNSFDLLVTLDTSDWKRVPEFLRDYTKNLPKLVIDHHGDNERFGDLNIIIPGAAATGVIVYNFAKFIDYNIDKVFAELIYITILGDTGRFAYSNTTKEVFDIVSELCETGIDCSEIYRVLFSNESPIKYKLLSYVLDNMELLLDGKLCLFKLPQSIVEKYNASKSDTEGFVDYTLKLRGVKIGVMAYIYEDKNEVKYSLRAVKGINLRDIVKVFGGGGHPQAAGCRINGAFEETWEKLLKEIKKYV